MPKLNPISLAAAAVIQVVELDAAAREAALKMPIKDAMRQLAGNLQADLDAALKVAIEQQLGHPLDDPEIVRGRLAVVSDAREETSERGETYCLDGVPILWRGPVAVMREGDTMTAKQTLKHLQAVGSP